MVFRRLFAIATSLLMLVGCNSTKQLTTVVASRPATLDYLVDGKTVEKIPLKIYLEPADTLNQRFSASYALTKTDGEIIPLIFYNKSSRDYIYRVGRESFQESPDVFLNTGFLREAERKCKYQFTDKREDADFILNLRLDSLQAVATLNKTKESYTVPFPIGYGGFSIHNNNGGVMEGAAFSQLSYTLVDGNGKVVMQGGLSAEGTVEKPEEINIYIPASNTFNTTNARVVTAVSESFRKNFTQLILLLNNLGDS